MTLGYYFNARLIRNIYKLIQNSGSYTYVGIATHQSQPQMLVVAIRYNSGSMNPFYRYININKNKYNN